MSIRRSLLLLTLVVAGFAPAWSAAAPEPDLNLRLFQAGDYAGYLTHLDEEVKRAIADPTAFDRVVAVAIALDKTQQWSGAPGKRAEALLARSPHALRYLRATRQVLGGDLGGMPLYFQQPYPDAQAWWRAMDLLRHHGYPLAADAFLIMQLVANDASGRGQESPVIQRALRTLLTLPPPQRKAMEEVLDHAFRLSRHNQGQAARTALQLCIHPRIDEAARNPGPSQFLALALRWGKDTGLINLNTASTLAEAGKKAEAAQVATMVAARAPGDPLVQAAAGEFVWRNADRPREAAALLRAAVDRLPEPDVRAVRLGYARLLRLSGLRTPTRPDSLLAADILLVHDSYPQAAAAYQAQLARDQAPLGRRLDAWAGLLAADPPAGLKAAPALLGEVQGSTPEPRAQGAAWMARQVWQTVEYEIPHPSGRVWRPTRRLSDAPGWETACAEIMDRLLAIDSAACLRHDPSTGSLRYPAALIFALAEKPAKAMDVLARPVTFSLNPPPGGWRDPLRSSPPPDADKPRTFTRPLPGEADGHLAKLLETVGTCPNASRLLPALRAAVFPHLLTRAGTATDHHAVAALTQCVAVTLSQSGAVPDPTRPGRNGEAGTREVTLEEWAPVPAVVREAIAADAVARQGPRILRDGLLPAMRAISNPKLRDDLFALIVLALDRYRDLTTDPKAVWTEASFVIMRLEGVAAPDAPPYAQRLKERYLPRR